MRDFLNRPLLYPIFRVYGSFMDIKRYEHMPYYFYPRAKEIISFENQIINFLDWTVDAHEETRNTEDRNRNFYKRSVYVWNNFMRFQNATVSNIMFEKDACNMAHQYLFVCFILNRLYTINHTNILAHLKRGFCKF